MNGFGGAIIAKAMATKPIKPLLYDQGSKKKFKSYFVKPQKKRGRPKKRKRGRPKKEHHSIEPKQSMMATTPTTIDLTLKDEDELDARLEGSLAKHKRERASRVNWDVNPHFKLRRRMADSWTNKNDLYTTGDSFRRFCIKMNIDRNVLWRYLDGKYKKNKWTEPCASARGRPAFLTENVMRHLCEGKCLPACMHIPSLCNSITTLQCTLTLFHSYQITRRSR